ncbi:hypothetical protein P43SY_001802 [Pythium insidiosum]|uniref:glucan 1,3-beta-glucosidase n=1 Tax=Pythium insidiosum TaxID=114742 RepID=A0AAD5M582_PYTIN|nr:hypothetical protein P43SY_001802 [Pythium insidiosum]
MRVLTWFLLGSASALAASATGIRSNLTGLRLHESNGQAAGHEHRQGDGNYQAPPSSPGARFIPKKLLQHVHTGASPALRRPPSDQHERWRHVQWDLRERRIPSRGVNLGGWLVAEYWMNRESDIWKGITEQQASAGEQTAFKNSKPRDVAISRYKWHRDNFITEEEIAAIAAAGLNTVRVPVGYWILGFDRFDVSNQKQWQNFAPGGLEYLDRLIRDWAWKHNVAVLISMHGAKGSQNGADHSAPEQKDRTFWSDYIENVLSTLDAVRFLAERYKNDDAFLGIGLLNEPSGSTNRDVLYNYYRQAYNMIRIEDQNDCILTIAPLLWEQGPAHMTELLPGTRNVWAEWHRYFVWGYEHSSEDELLYGEMDRFRHDVELWKKFSDKPMFIGEFSFATAGKFHDQARLKEFARRQMQVLTENVDGGWTFWSWRIYGDEWGVNPWSLRNLIRNGIFPKLPPVSA